MNLDREDQLASQLAAWDEALAEGATPKPGDTDDLSPEMQARLDRGLECMKLLHEARPRRRRDGGSGTAEFVGESEGPAKPRVTLHAETQQEPHPLDSTPSAPEDMSLGRFQIRRELGRGGFGVVFLAYDPQLNREVALKVPRVDALVAPELRQRFQQEARAAAGLDHPNIVPVYEAGEVGPITYIASAYCPGVTLAAWIKQRPDPVPFNDAAELTATLADAVQHAHSRGVVHRDLKPANVLLSAAGDRPSAIGQKNNTVEPTADGRMPMAVKITDFGLAKLMDAETTGPSTKTGAVLGTPSYMAPEQAGGKTAELGPAVDVYALGATLYELLTGWPPFRGESDLDTLLQVQYDEPLQPGRLRPKLPRDLETICLKCLQKEPRLRYASARELGEDLRRFLRQEPILARPVGIVGRTWRWCRRRPAVAGLVAALAAVFIIGLSGIIWQWQDAVAGWNYADAGWTEAQKERDTAIKRRDEAEDSLLRGMRAVDESFTKISEEALLNAEGMQPLRKQLLESHLKYYQEFLAQRADDAKLQAEVANAYSRIGTILQVLGQFPQARVALESARDRFIQIVQACPDEPTYRLKLAECNGDLSRVYFQLGEFGPARASQWSALETLEEIVQADANNWKARFLLAQQHHSAANLKMRVGENAAALAFLDKAVRMLEVLVREQPKNHEIRQESARSYYDIAVVHHDQDRVPEALEASKRARAIQEELVQDAPKVVNYQRHLARIYDLAGRVERLQKRNDRAMEFFLKSLEIQEKLAAENPKVVIYQYALAHTLGAVGNALDALGEWQEALDAYERAHTILLALIEQAPESHSYYATAGQNLHSWADRLRRLNMLDDAERLGKEAVRFTRTAADKMPTHSTYRWLLGEHYIQMARIYHLQGRPKETVEAALEIVKLRPDDASELRNGAARLAACISLVGRDLSTLSPEQQAERQSYADQAMDLLRRAVARGYKNEKGLKENRDFEPLRSRDDFQKLLAGLEKTPPK